MRSWYEFVAGKHGVWVIGKQLPDWPNFDYLNIDTKFPVASLRQYLIAGFNW